MIFGKKVRRSLYVQLYDSPFYIIFRVLEGRKVTGPETAANSKTKTNMAQVEIIRTTAAGAKLISNGVVAAWVQGRFVRPDNTLTRRGEEIMAAATMTDEQARNYDAHIAQLREERAAAWERERAAAREAVEVAIKKDSLVGGTERALKIWMGGYTLNQYRKRVKLYIYLPTSQVEVLSETSTSVILLMPTWLRNKYDWAAIAA